MVIPVLSAASDGRQPRDRALLQVPNQITRILENHRSASIFEFCTGCSSAEQTDACHNLGERALPSMNVQVVRVNHGSVDVKQNGRHDRPTRFSQISGL